MDRMNLPKHWDAHTMLDPLNYKRIVVRNGLHVVYVIMNNVRMK